ncbi:unnamed protein product [Closterium sp. NIES-64]|nr:unnamed protein product [Closterium sp. NIES-64]
MAQRQPRRQTREPTEEQTGGPISKSNETSAAEQTRGITSVTTGADSGAPERGAAGAGSTGEQVRLGGGGARGGSAGAEETSVGPIQGMEGGPTAGMGAPIRMGDVVPEEQLSAEEKSRPVTKAGAAEAQREETAAHGVASFLFVSSRLGSLSISPCCANHYYCPVKGGTAATLQSAADKNVQAGVVPPMKGEKASARTGSLESGSAGAPGATAGETHSKGA